MVSELWLPPQATLPWVVWPLVHCENYTCVSQKLSASLGGPWKEILSFHSRMLSTIAGEKLTHILSYTWVHWHCAHIFFFIYSTDIYYVPGRSQILGLLQRTAQIMTLFILSLNFSKGVGWNNYTEIYKFQVMIGSMVYKKQGDVIKIKSAGYLRAQQILCDCGMERRFRILFVIELRCD